MGGQLAADRGVVGDRVALERREVDQVDEHRAALDVGEELVTEAGALRCPFDQARDVGQDRLAILVFDRPQHRVDRRERVVGHLRVGAREPPQQRGLAGVREPDQARVGEQLQPQLDPVLLPRGPPLGKARGLPGRGREAPVSVPPASAVGDDRALAGLDEVDPTAVDRLRLGPGRHRDLAVLAAGAVPVGALAVSAASRPEVLAPAQRAEVAPRGIADQDHVTAMAPVAAVGTAARDMGLAAEADRAVAAGAGLDPDLRAIVHRDTVSRFERAMRSCATVRP